MLDEGNNRFKIRPPETSFACYERTSLIGRLACGKVPKGHHENDIWPVVPTIQDANLRLFGHYFRLARLSATRTGCQFCAVAICASSLEGIFGGAFGKVRLRGYLRDYLCESCGGMMEVLMSESAFDSLTSNAA